MPPKKSIVSDDEFSDDDELFSEDEEDVKPGTITSILRGGLPKPDYTTFNTRHLNGEPSPSARRGPSQR
jgi:hypothetical protein